MTPFPMETPEDDRRSASLCGYNCQELGKTTLSSLGMIMPGSLLALVTADSVHGSFTEVKTMSTQQRALRAISKSCPDLSNI